MPTLALCLCAEVASAQGAPISDADLPWANGDDPIGVQREDADLDRVPTLPQPPDAQAFGPKPPALSARNGDVLIAPALVRETQHRVHLEWQAGLMLVTTELHFTTTSTHPAEVKYRLPVPAGATLASLQVCTTTGCRDGLVERNPTLLSAYDDAVQSRGPGSGLPVGHARAVSDERGPAIALRAAPVRANQELLIRVAFLVPAPVRGGAVRLSLPARGMDERAAHAEVTLDAPDLTAVSLGDAPITPAPAVLEPWRPITLVARVVARSPADVRWLRYACGDQSCARLWIAGAAAAASSLDVALVIDASPSMRGPARGRVAATLAALLALLPPERRLAVAVFAADARIVHESVAAGELALAPLIDASQAEDLGSGTRFTTAWDALRSWTERPAPTRSQKLMVVIGDGSIGRRQEAAFTEAQRRGITISWVNLADRTTDPALNALVETTGGITVQAAAASATATGGGDPGALEEALSELFATHAASQITLRPLTSRRDERIKLGTLRAGSEIVWTGTASRAARLLAVTTQPRSFGSLVARSRTGIVGERLEQALAMTADNPTGALAAVDPADLPRAGDDRPRPALQCDPRGPAQRLSGISSDVDPISLAESRPCRGQNAGLNPVQPPSTTPGVGMPASPLLTMLRQRILPVARACFRRDRAGRAEYELRATFELELANQEVTDASVVGNVPEPLRACLIDAAERLEVPFFTGTVHARYPLRTQSEPLPDEIELTPGVAADLDRLLDGDGGALHTPPAF